MVCRSGWLTDCLRLVVAVFLFDTFPALRDFTVLLAFFGLLTDCRDVFACLALPTLLVVFFGPFALVELAGLFPVFCAMILAPRYPVIC